MKVQMESRFQPYVIKVETFEDHRLLLSLIAAGLKEYGSQENIKQFKAQITEGFRRS